MANRKHCVSKLIRMTPDEAKLLSTRSKQMGMTESGYLRFMISQKPSDYPEIRMLTRELINEINHIGVNINQITHNNNSNLYSEQDKRILTAYMRKIESRMNKVVDIVGGQ